MKNSATIVLIYLGLFSPSKPLINVQDDKVLSYQLSYNSIWDQKLKAKNYFFSTKFPLTFNSSSLKEGEEERGILSKVKPELTSQQTYHGSVPPYAWGVTCSGDETTNCKFINPIAGGNATYAGSSFSYLLAITYFSIGNGSRIDTSQSPMPIRLINGTQDDSRWVLGDAGLLGLSPRSSLWKYLMRQEDVKEYSMSFYIDNSEDDFWYEVFEGNKLDLFGGSLLEFSSRPEDLVRGKEEVVWTLNSSPDFWQFEDVKIYLGSDEETPVHSGAACLLMDSPYFLVSRKSGKIKDIVMENIKEKSKTGQEMSPSNAPEITVVVTGEDGTEKKLTIAPEDYAYYQKDLNISLSIGPISSQDQSLCSKDSEFGFGRMFLFKKFLIFKLKLQEDSGSLESSIGISNYTKRPKLKNPPKNPQPFGLDKTILIYSIAAAFLLIIACTFVIRCFSGRKKSGSSIDKDSLRLSFNSMNMDTKVVALDTDTARGFTDRNNQSDRLDYFMKVKEN